MIDRVDVLWHVTIPIISIPLIAGMINYHLQPVSLIMINDNDQCHNDSAISCTFLLYANILFEEASFLANGPHLHVHVSEVFSLPYSFISHKWVSMSTVSCSGV